MLHGSALLRLRVRVLSLLTIAADVDVLPSPTVLHVSELLRLHVCVLSLPVALASRVPASLSPPHRAS